MTFLRSALFMAWFLLLTAGDGESFSCRCWLMPRQATVWMARQWARGTLWGLAVFCGTGMRVKGDAPQGGVLVASKHMSMWDTLALYIVLDDPAIVLKRGLLHIPFYGWYLWKATAMPSTAARAPRRCGA
jgi:1-acyl-sn-glycerol-3-phosphate acyltransferase